MNNSPPEPLDDLERELARLAPSGPSNLLRERIAAELRTGVRPNRRSPLWWSALVSGAVAASLLAGWLLLRQGLPTLPSDATAGLQAGKGRPPVGVAGGVGRPAPNTGPAPNGAAAVVTALAGDKPSVWAYSRALARSSGEFESLLDQHAAFAHHDVAATHSPNVLVSEKYLILRGEL
jgi:hypothetical protein